MRLPAWLTTRKGSVNGHSPDPSPPDCTDVRVATELGEALIAYWRNGGWFGCDTFIRWLINHGHVAEAAYALQTIAAVQRDEEAAKNVRERMRGPENKLAERLRETLPVQLPDSLPGVLSQEPLPGPAQAS